MLLTKPTIENEWTLIEKAKRNSEDFRPLYEKYYKPIFLFVLRRIGDKELTADITSQVFLKALQGIAKYTDQGVPFRLRFNYVRRNKTGFKIL